MSLFRGSAVALVTPFNEDGSVNFEELERLIEFQIENKTDALVICGTTGEASTMTDEEQVETIKFAVEKTKGRVPVIAGAGSNDTRHGINLAKMCEDVGADGLLEVTPYYNKTSQRGLYEHYKVIAEAVNIPIILYDVPGRTSMSIAPQTVKELAEIDNIVGLKDASGNLSYAAEVRNLVGEDFDVYSGNDDVVVPLMSIGGIGVISVLANIYPRQVHDMCQNFFDGNIKEAGRIQVNNKKLIDALFVEPNPIPIKAAMNMMGYNVGGLRLPLYEAADSTKELLKGLLR
ncbi:4-hydroxy-tetrahydrodipicolinate synthase [Peptoniphilus obesi]|uniref:4-hydroxy-tetrahydrodipicolinate synthase n=1 Tax=Peptoniphilus obesi TaxID=1472765 RepID=UPI0004B61EA7|nr:4-hydroxy-tetrahydrodipicolinate synthase [Peptoniphilus obesi]